MHLNRPLFTYSIYEIYTSSLTVAENYAKRSIILSVQVSLGSRKFQRYEEPQQMIEMDVSPLQHDVGKW